MASSWGRVLRRAATTGLRSVVRSTSRPASRGSYPGDFHGSATITYAPEPNGSADPGEIVWGWVPFEEDSTRGKDRPALVVGDDGPWVLALMLTSKDHDAPDRSRRDDRGGMVWHDIGSGDWDRRERPSEVRLDRVLRLDPDAIRREGGRLDRARFDDVATRLRALHGWE